MTTEEKVLQLMRTDVRAAEALVHQVITEKGHSAQTYFLQGFIYSSNVNYPKAIAAFKQALALQPDQFKIYFSLGYCYQQLQQLDEALAMYQKAAELTRYRKLLPIIACANVHHQLGNVGQAIQIYQQILASRSNQPIALFYLTQALKEAGRFDEVPTYQQQLKHLLSTPATISRFIQLVAKNDYSEWAQFNNKRTFNDIVTAYQKVKKNAGQNYYPTTFALPEQTPALKACFDQKPCWILKPENLSGGQQIRLTNTWHDIPEESGWIAQEYIANPFLIQGRKFNVRLYLVVASYEPFRTFLSRNGIVFLATEKYPSTLDPKQHNQAHIANPLKWLKQSPYELAINEYEEGSGNFWSMPALVKYLLALGVDMPSVWKRLDDLAQYVVQLIQYTGIIEHQTQKRIYYGYPPKLLGLDITFDDKLNPYLLEIERYPGLDSRIPIVNATQNHFKNTFITLLTSPSYLGSQAFYKLG